MTGNVLRSVIYEHIVNRNETKLKFASRIEKPSRVGVEKEWHSARLFSFAHDARGVTG